METKKSENQIVSYPAVFHQDEGEAFWVEFPDLDGCLTCGENADDALSQAQEALEGYIFVMIDEEKKLPEPTGVEEYSPEDGFVSLVNCDLGEYTRVQ